MTQLHGIGVASARVVEYEQLDSTNSEALRLARAGERGPLWIVARAQSAGRGRQGRRWDSPRGNLHATLLLAQPRLAAHGGGLSLLTALAAHDAIGATAPALRTALALKWPNDVLCRGAKICGILIEAERVPNDVALAFGIGVNCGSFPSDTDFPATSLKAAGADVAPATLRAALARSMQERLAQLGDGEGFARLRAEWLDRAPGLGGRVSVRLGGRDIEGRFETLDPIGRLVLRRLDGGLELIVSGDVFPMHGVSADRL
ncbi:MAG: biotin--[acetyl-CoA-carboxylase] ligase [Proteobacteria bacterium]|nr:biotin--[acetyl-CoA-carboxylase] ligase [Pseudomonadota bacterium]